VLIILVARQRVLAVPHDLGVIGCSCSSSPGSTAQRRTDRHHDRYYHQRGTGVAPGSRGIERTCGIDRTATAGCARRPHHVIVARARGDDAQLQTPRLLRSDTTCPRTTSTPRTRPAAGSRFPFPPCGARGRLGRLGVLRITVSACTHPVGVPRRARCRDRRRRGDPHVITVIAISSNDSPRRHAATAAAVQHELGSRVGDRWMRAAYRSRPVHVQAVRGADAAGIRAGHVSPWLLRVGSRRRSLIGADEGRLGATDARRHMVSPCDGAMALPPTIGVRG
jgi:hypothetical protein